MKTIIFSLDTEVWDFENIKNKTISPTLRNFKYAYGIAVYAVDFDFCQK